MRPALASCATDTPPRNSEPSAAAGVLVNPGERGRAHGEVEAVIPRLGRLEGLVDDVNVSSGDSLRQVPRHRRIRLGCGDPGAARQHPPGHPASAGTDFQHTRAWPEPALAGQDVIHLVRVLGPARIVASRVSPVRLTSSLPQ
jgi:hypothetical protein